MAKADKKRSEIIHNLTKKHWIWYSIIVSLPTLWFTLIVGVFGKVLHIKSSSGEYTKVGIGISIVVILLSIGILLYNNWYSSKSEFGELETLKGKIQYLDTITDSVDRICDEKATQLRRIIHEVKTGIKKAPDIISNPNNQLTKILEQIAFCMAKMMEKPDGKYSYRDFFVTIAYRFPYEIMEWVWLDGTVERGLSLMELTDPNNKTTFNYIKNGQKPYYFNNRKEDARRDDKYMYDSFDSENEAEGKPVGSILCYNFKIKQNNNLYIDAILSISTQGKRFAEDGNPKKIENTRENMITLIKEHFGRRIQIELSLLYLSFLNEQNN